MVPWISGSVNLTWLTVIPYEPRIVVTSRNLLPLDVTKVIDLAVIVIKSFGVSRKSFVRGELCSCRCEILALI